LAFANASEWVMHKYVLHGLGKNKKSFWSFHWHDHHNNARKNGHLDADYNGSVFQWNGQGKEALALTLTGLAWLPVFPVAPFFVGTIIYSGINYYRKHKRAHLDPEWARQNLPWHYDHHMGPNQNCNWCVTKPWMDELMGTRVPYVGTEAERKALAKKAARAARKAQREQPAQPSAAPA
ncbi:MAG: sterol desaturase family protein, partial [Deltaproteobacteria bacterium]|nr:sterol desaturase family protein [Deltaproteobacteria bacterium]